MSSPGLQPGQAYKVCPQCQTPAAIDAPQCASCGRAYRTQFTQPISQTTVIQAQPAPSAAVPLGGFGQQLRRPVDFEWRLKAFWAWFGALQSAYWLYWSIVLLAGSAAMPGFGGDLVRAFTWWFLIGSAGILSACSLSLWKLYGYRETGRGFEITAGVLGLVLALSIVGGHMGMTKPKAPVGSGPDASRVDQVDQAVESITTRYTISEVLGVGARNEADLRTLLGEPERTFERDGRTVYVYRCINGLAMFSIGSGGVVISREAGFDR